jgi:hypothetical protein
MVLVNSGFNTQNNLYALPKRFTSPVLRRKSLKNIGFKGRQIIILNGVQNYELARGAHISWAGPACEINMGHMDSPYLTGDHPIIRRDSNNAHKVASSEVQEIKLKKKIRSPVFSDKQLTADQYSTTYSVSDL